MKLQSKVLVASFSVFLCFHHGICEMPEPERWICQCATESVLDDNCSSACDCKLGYVRAVEGEMWTCLCGISKTPRTSGDTHDASCFSSCNCTTRILNPSTGSKKHITRKTVLSILLAFVGLMAGLLLAFLMFYIHRKNEDLTQMPTFSSSEDTSWNSATNLICRRSILENEFQMNPETCFNPFSGCIYVASFLLKENKLVVPGTIIKFSYSELQQATRNFSKINEIGHGGSSVVYHARIRDGRDVAVKKFNTQRKNDDDLEFLSEVELISRLHHCHVVSLIGYCAESQGKNSKRLLVFEYMSNGNLRDCLDGIQGSNHLDWRTRVQIAVGASKGLEYLHESAAPKILHRDVKTTNILLDEKWDAKITDFGMAKPILSDENPYSPPSPARMMGTFGYFAPEYAISGKASVKSDVFSFGVILLELISGRQPINKSPNAGKESLVIWAVPHLHNDQWVVNELADPLLKDNFPREEIRLMTCLASQCLHFDPESRPSMREVVQILSAIDQNKSMNKIPANFFQGILLHTHMNARIEEMERSPRIGEEIEDHTHELDIESMTDEDVIQLYAEKQSALSSSLFTTEDDKKDDIVISVEYMEKLAHLTTKTTQAIDEESMDLNEPNLESF